MGLFDFFKPKKAEKYTKETLENTVENKQELDTTDDEISLEEFYLLTRPRGNRSVVDFGGGGSYESYDDDNISSYEYLKILEDAEDWNRNGILDKDEQY